MENSNHVKNLVNPSLTRFIIQELMNENSILNKKRKSLIDDENYSQNSDELEKVVLKLNQNIEWLTKMETLLEMEEKYKNKELPQGYTFNPTLSGLNNPKNR
jgi:hypothetical protein